MTLLVDVSCTASSCLNGGQCISGVCQCPFGYQGSTCATCTYL